MKPKQAQIKALEDSGDLKRVTRQITAAHLLANMAVGLYLDAQDILHGYHLIMGEKKQKATRLQASFEAFIGEYTKLVRVSRQDLQFAEDYDHFRPIILKALNMEDLA